MRRPRGLLHALAALEYESRCLPQWDVLSAGHAPDAPSPSTPAVVGTRPAEGDGGLLAQG